MIRTVSIFAIACALGLFIQGTMIHPLSPSVVSPDFIVILVVYLALYIPSTAGLLGAYALGLAQDFASGQFVGPNAAGTVVAFYLTVVIARKVYAENVLAVALLTTLVCVAKSLVYALIVGIYLDINILFRNQVTVAALGIPVIALEALCSGLVSPLVVKLLRVTKKSVVLR